MPQVEIVHCGQRGCTGTFTWARTLRDPVRKVGGRTMPVDWPPPVDRRNSDGTLLPPAEGLPVPNLGYRFDQHGSLIVRVLTREEPIRVDERAAYPHWATCKNPPAKHRTRPVVKPAARVSDDQEALDLGVDPPSARRAPGPLSSQRLFPPRRRG